MAIYHCSCKVISRNSGHSAVGASAYRSGTEMTSEYDGITHNYTPKGNTGQVVYSEVMLCENAPEEYRNREVLWNEVERAEKGSNAQLAREYEFALPRELSHAEQIEFTREFVRENFVKDGMCADIAIHDKGDGNPHAHAMVPLRPIDENGKWENKAEKLYLCKNSKGEERAFTSKELSKDENAEWKKQYHYSKNGNPKGKKVYLSEYEISKNPKYKDFERIKGDKYPKTEKFGKQNAKIEKWNSKEFLERVRENLAVAINKELERKELPQRVDHRSYKEQGVDKIPTIHEGKSARARERKRKSKNPEYQERYKEPTDRIETNKRIRKENREIDKTNRLIGKIQDNMEWYKIYTKHDHLVAMLEKNPANEYLQKQALKHISELETDINKLVMKQEQNGHHSGKKYDVGYKVIPYVEFRAEHAYRNLEMIKAVANQNLVEIDMQRNPQDYVLEPAEQERTVVLQTEEPHMENQKDTAPLQPQPAQAHTDLNKSEVQAVQVEAESSTDNLQNVHADELIEAIRDVETKTQEVQYAKDVLMGEYRNIDYDRINMPEYLRSIPVKLEEAYRTYHAIDEKIRMEYPRPEAPKQSMFTSKKKTEQYQQEIKVWEAKTADLRAVCRQAYENIGTYFKEAEKFLEKQDFIKGYKGYGGYTAGVEKINPYKMDSQDILQVKRAMEKRIDNIYQPKADMERKYADKVIGLERAEQALRSSQSRLEELKQAVPEKVFREAEMAVQAENKAKEQAKSREQNRSKNNRGYGE